MVNNNLYSRHQLTQLMFGKHATTSFDVESEEGKLKAKTICPKCGCILGGL